MGVVTLRPRWFRVLGTLVVLAGSGGAVAYGLRSHAGPLPAAVASACLAQALLLAMSVLRLVRLSINWLTGMLVVALVGACCSIASVWLDSTVGFWCAGYQGLMAMLWQQECLGRAA